ncbi:MAG: T9SS type A sorting domain-containing protein [Muribaculaceae bacterium]|nr:T9SS type A sorting domain-containing protein [Muribaculaceae bacterium]
MKSFGFKRLGLSGLLILCGLPVLSHNAVKLTDEEAKETIFMLGDHPRVAMEGRNVNISSDKGNISYEVENVLRFEFIDYDPTGIGSLTVYPVVFNFIGGTLAFENLTPGSPVFLFDASGKTLRVEKAGPDGIAELGTEGFPSGVYLVKVADQGFKFYKR